MIPPSRLGLLGVSQSRRRTLLRWLEEHCNHSKSCKKRLFSSSLRRKDDFLPNSTLPKPRLDYRSISENARYKSHNTFNRKSPIPVGAVQSVARLYEEHKQLSAELNVRIHTRSSVGDRIRYSGANLEVKKAAVEEAKTLKAVIARLEQTLAEIDDKMLSLGLAIPNDTHPETPLGSEKAAVTLSTRGPTPIPASTARDHVVIGRALDLLDLEAASTVTGSSWYYLLNEGALLEAALVQYALSKAIMHGFKPITTPDVVKSDIAMRCGFQPRDKGDPPTHQMYHLQTAGHHTPELVLSGTAEIPLAGFFVNKILQEDQLPAKLVGLGRAFRSEAGARGTDTRGLYRVHQFTKLELFAVCAQHQSEEMMNEMRELQMEIFEGLGLPIRVLDMPTEELGASAYRKFDTEAWMPGRGSWGEVSSTSNCTDYQSRRLHIRYRPSTTVTTSPQSHSPLPFAHTLNGTAAAIPRLIVALLENGARFDEKMGLTGINLPSSLQPFWLGQEGFGKANIKWL